MPTTPKAKLNVQTVGQVTAVSFVDRMLVNEDLIREVGEQLNAVAGAPHVVNLLVDFRDVRFMSSSLLGLMLPLLRSIERRGGKMKLCNVAPSLKEVFTVSKLDRLFALYENDDEALAAF